MVIWNFIKGLFSILSDVDAIKSIRIWLPALVISIVTTIWGEISGAPLVILFVIFLVTLASMLIIIHYFIKGWRILVEKLHTDSHSDNAQDIVHEEKTIAENDCLRWMRLSHELEAFCADRRLSERQRYINPNLRKTDPEEYRRIFEEHSHERNLESTVWYTQYRARFNSRVKSALKEMENLNILPSEYPIMSGVNIVMWEDHAELISAGAIQWANQNGLDPDKLAAELERENVHR